MQLDNFTARINSKYHKGQWSPWPEASCLIIWHWEEYRCPHFCHQIRLIWASEEAWFYSPLISQYFSTKVGLMKRDHASYQCLSPAFFGVMLMPEEGDYRLNRLLGVLCYNADHFPPPGISDPVLIVTSPTDVKHPPQMLLLLFLLLFVVKTRMEPRASCM